MTQVTFAVPDDIARSGVMAVVADLLAKMTDESDAGQFARVAMFDVLGVALDVVAPEQAIEKYHEHAAAALDASLDPDRDVFWLGAEGYLVGWHAALDRLPEFREGLSID